MNDSIEINVTELNYQNMWLWTEQITIPLIYQFAIQLQLWFIMKTAMALEFNKNNNVLSNSGPV